MAMQVFELFLPSLLIGVSVAAPVGPIGVLTIQRSLQYGPRAGLATGLGAAAADAVYGAVGAFGVSWLIRALVAVRLPMVIAGSAFLLWMAWQLVRARAAPMPSPGGTDSGSLWRYFAGTFVLTLSNPATILSFIAIFGAMAGRSAIAEPATLVLGVLLGSAAWWLFLSSAVGRLRHRFDARWQQRTHQASAVVLVLFALWQVASVAD
ncbi:MAG: LysE family transporter [Burkholderiales bacterium]|nr:LysE family transporter [Burkholderiales bacterium]